MSETKSPINTKQDALIARLTCHSDWSDRYTEIIQMGKNIQPMDDSLCTDDNKIAGCQSQVWIHAGLSDGRIQLQGHSDALIVRGILSMVLHIYHDATPTEILQSPAYFIEAVGLADHLSITRKNGLGSMLKQIQYYALAYQALLGR